MADSTFRRDFLKLLAGAALIPLIGCGGQADDTDEDATPLPSGTCEPIPEETAGPYPGDGSNGPNALSLSGIVRSDIRASIAGATAVATGVLLTVKLTVVDDADCTPLPGRAVYLWHCDKDGNYSMYSAAASAQNYLRGVQETDANGEVSFTTIFPGCYDGRMPHMHFEVYPSLASATSSTAKVATSQLAFPDAPCDAVYATSAYTTSATNYARISFSTDNVFSDGVDEQLAEMTGDVTAGYVATLTVPV
jgi:protocatechuate 3,4-dioxygenase beta subunit